MTVSGFLGSRNRQKAHNTPSGHQRLHLDQHILNSDYLGYMYLSELKPMFSLRNINPVQLLKMY